MRPRAAVASFLIVLATALASSAPTAHAEGADDPSYVRPTDCQTWAPAPGGGHICHRVFHTTRVVTATQHLAGGPNMFCGLTHPASILTQRGTPMGAVGAADDHYKKDLCDEHYVIRVAAVAGFDLPKNLVFSRVVDSQLSAVIADGADTANHPAVYEKCIAGAATMLDAWSSANPFLAYADQFPRHGGVVTPKLRTHDAIAFDGRPFLKDWVQDKRGTGVIVLPDPGLHVRENNRCIAALGTFVLFVDERLPY